MKRLIFTADDLGLAPETNAGIERAHREGVLTAASLMVGEAGFEEGLRVARANPGLAVGLHLTLTDGVPVLPAAQIPGLTQKNGRFRDDMAGLGLLLALSPMARAELAAEVAAQIERFTATGLVCDHVNAHKHYHLHPLIAAALMQAAAGAGVRCIRLPWEPGSLVRAVDAASPGQAEWALKPWCATLRKRALNWNLLAPERVLGLAWSGHFGVDRLLGILPLLPDGVTELYFHPATQGGFAGSAPGYAYAEELAALCDPRVAEALAGIPRGGYAAMLLPKPLPPLS
ncbi:hopanoid biosynthesis-associated protein HpnK [Sediminicoccus sp. KRV36]|uniref:hopanoid biosynthesis-associated protein HpnK n=1 Tax=Sediminicoccus sp. KRV36 TaxID=3133721 RepID=UPI002010B3E5|nr:hopanoid biosynthesis-associated protein HpnK [Sediminicoccus rosea]UPY35113.1 hopanoid biosynthesis-associated protein HpnK [Sediminicoccus rosea]